jgi:hypothetical protein
MDATLIGALGFMTMLAFAGISAWAFVEADLRGRQPLFALAGVAFAISAMGLISAIRSDDVARMINGEPCETRYFAMPLCFTNPPTAPRRESDSSA